MCWRVGLLVHHISPLEETDAKTMLWLRLRMTSAMTMCVTSLARSAPSDTSRYRGLDDSIDDEDIRAFFSQFGTVTGVAQHRWAAFYIDK